MLVTGKIRNTREDPDVSQPIPDDDQSQDHSSEGVGNDDGEDMPTVNYSQGNGNSSIAGPSTPTMVEDRLSALTVLSIERELAEKIDMHQ